MRVYSFPRPTEPVTDWILGCTLYAERPWRPRPRPPNAGPSETLFLTNLAGTFMGEYRSARTRRTRRDQPPPKRSENSTSLECSAASELLASARVVAFSRRARALVSSYAPERRADVSRPCRNRPGQGRRPLATRRSWFAGRAPGTGRAAGEPMTGAVPLSAATRAGLPTIARDAPQLQIVGEGGTEQPGALLTRAASRSGRTATPPRSAPMPPGNPSLSRRGVL